MESRHPKSKARSPKSISSQPPRVPPPVPVELCPFGDSIDSIVMAVILAAGRGTRMGPLTADVPKPLLPLRGRPIIEHVLAGLRSAGIGEAVIVTGYRADQFEACLGTGERLQMQLQYCRQESLDGTARALLLTRQLVGSRSLLLSWGDVLVERHVYAAVRDEFRRAACEVVLAVNPVDDPWRGAAVYVDENWRVTQVIEKPPRGSSRTCWNNAGICACTPLIYTYAERASRSARNEYELPQAISAMIADGCPVRAHPVRGFWSDLGTPEDLARAEQTYPG